MSTSSSPGPVLKKASKNHKSIEQIYQKKSQLEHILIRPDTYIGSVELIKSNLWVYDSIDSKMKYKSIEYVPGLYKIFDEIIVNAADNKVLFTFI
jgi:DNA topoisomerase-2